MRSHKEDCSFFDEEIKQFLMNFNDTIPQMKIQSEFDRNNVNFQLTILVGGAF